MTQSPLTSPHRELESSTRASTQLVLMRHSDPFTVLVHNPGISHAASDLLGRAIGLGTAVVVALPCSISDWSTPLTAGNADLVPEMKPKSLDRDEGVES